MRKFSPRKLILGVVLLIGASFEKTEAKGGLRGQNRQKEAPSEVPRIPEMSRRPPPQQQQTHDYEHRGYSHANVADQHGRGHHRDLHDIDDMDEDRYRKLLREDMMRHQAQHQQQHHYHQQQPWFDQLYNQPKRRKDQEETTPNSHYKPPRVEASHHNNHQRQTPSEIAHQAVHQRHEQPPIHQQHSKNRDLEQQDKEKEEAKEERNPYPPHDHRFYSYQKGLERKAKETVQKTALSLEAAVEAMDKLQDLLIEEMEVRDEEAEEEEEKIEESIKSHDRREIRQTQAEIEKKHKGLSEIDDAIRKLQSLLEEHHQQHEEETAEKEEDRSTPTADHSDLRKLLEQHQNVKAAQSYDEKKPLSTYENPWLTNGHGHPRSGYSDVNHKESHSSPNHASHNKAEAHPTPSLPQSSSSTSQQRRPVPKNQEWTPYHPRSTYDEENRFSFFEHHPGRRDREKEVGQQKHYKNRGSASEEARQHMAEVFGGEKRAAALSSYERDDKRHLHEGSSQAHIIHKGEKTSNKYGSKGREEPVLCPPKNKNPLLNF